MDGCLGRADGFVEDHKTEDGWEPVLDYSLTLEPSRTVLLSNKSKRRVTVGEERASCTL